MADPLVAGGFTIAISLLYLRFGERIADLVVRAIEGDPEIEDDPEWEEHREGSDSRRL
ncbi:MAG: hypothetical protein ABEJ27_05145 [Halodesulfurarchaeum sp.]